MHRQVRPQRRRRVDPQQAWAVGRFRQGGLSWQPFGGGVNLLIAYAAPAFLPSRRSV